MSLREIALAAHVEREERLEEERRQRAAAKRAENITNLARLLKHHLNLDALAAGDAGIWSDSGGSYRTEGIAFWIADRAGMTRRLIAGLPCHSPLDAEHRADYCRGSVLHREVDSIADLGELLAGAGGDTVCAGCRQYVRMFIDEDAADARQAEAEAASTEPAVPAEALPF